MTGETPSSEQLGERVADAARGLSEHCDSVLIITTLYDGEGTISRYGHIGNVFAVESSVRAWLRKYAAGELEDPA
jgi:hypothetical protein